MRARRHLAALAATALALAACGGGDDADPEADGDAAEAAIEALVEELEDDGFVVEEDDDDGDDPFEFDDEDCERFADAFPEDGEIEGKTADEQVSMVAGSVEEDGAETTVEATVGFVEDEGTVEELFALLRDDELPDCLEEAVVAGFDAEQSGIELGDIAVDADEGPDLGEESVALDIELDIAGFPLTLELIAVRDGRMAVLLSVSVFGDGASDVDAEDLAELLVDEARSA